MNSKPETRSPETEIPPPRLVLASTSPYRRELLNRLGLPFTVVAPRYKEQRLDLPHEELARAHALGKAESLADVCPEALIIGSDQVLSFEGGILGKPGTKEAAAAQLLRLQGRTHRLITAVALHEAGTGRSETAVDVHEMTLRPLGEAAVKAYVEREDPIDCAGAYKVEGLGIALFSAIRGTDDTAIVGLPLLRLVDLLLDFGIDLLRGR